MLEQKWVFETVPGREHPERWPEGLDKMAESLLKMNRLELFTEEPSIHEETLQNLEKFIQKEIAHLNNLDSTLDAQTLEQKTEQLCKGISRALTCLMLLAFHFADFVVFLRILKLLDVEEVETNENSSSQNSAGLNKKLVLSIPNAKRIIDGLLPNILMPISDYLGNILAIKSIPDQPSANPHCTISSFSLPGSILPLESRKNIVSLTTDNQYLYLIVASKNGCMLKIGTGEAGTKRGYIYKSR